MRHTKYDMRNAKYIFGPVPSRRLGLSLGVDIVPFKICTLDCIYCQIGRTTQKAIERKEYVPIESVLAELKAKLAGGLKADFITLSGSGEPTLHSRFGELIKKIKKITDIPVAILTNGTLFGDEQVRADCALADVVLPSLDAADEQTFRKINRPHSDISIEKLILGLVAFRHEFSGQIWLEVFLVEGINTGAEQIAKIRSAIKRIKPDKIQLNTAVRPTADFGIKKIKAEKLRAIAQQLGYKAEVVVDFSQRHHTDSTKDESESNFDVFLQDREQTVLSVLKRRPCSLDDICSALNMHRNEALKYISHLQQQGVIDSQIKDGVVFFQVG